jgi:PAS domain S-box-containing protein
VDSKIIGIFILDFECQIMEANEAFLHMVGYDHEELVASRIRWTYLTPPDWRDRDARWIQEHKITGTLRPIEKECFRKDGSRVPVLIGAATFEDGGNQGVAFVLDLTSANALRNCCASWSRSAISPRRCAYQRTGSVLTPFILLSQRSARPNHKRIARDLRAIDRTKPDR